MKESLIKRAEEYLYTWHDKKYGGSPEIGDWTPNDALEFAADFALSQTGEEQPEGDVITKTEWLKWFLANIQEKSPEDKALSFRIRKGQDEEIVKIILRFCNDMIQSQKQAWEKRERGLVSLLANAECPNECVDGKFKNYNPPLGTEEITCPWCQDREELLNKQT